MESAQQEYEKQMMQKAQKEYHYLHTDKQNNNVKLFSFNSSHHKPNKDVDKTTNIVMKIKTVKPEKATGIENSIIKAAQSGMLKNRLTEKELVALLEKDS